MADKSVIVNIEARVKQLIGEHREAVRLNRELTTERDALKAENRALQERIRALDAELARAQLTEGLDRAVELSSMGIRVDKAALEKQLKESGKEDRKELYFHKRLLEGSLPLSVGGGIGQSRLCMVLLHKAHVGETQSSIWPEAMRKECQEAGMTLI